MKVKGIKVEYYMKNGVMLVDDAIKFNQPLDRSGSDYQKTFDYFKDLAKQSLKSESGGHVVMGFLYVRASEVQAIRLIPIEE